MSKSWRQPRGKSKGHHRHMPLSKNLKRRFRVERERAEGRRNPDQVPVGLCELDNPRRWHKRTLRRSWKHRDRFHDAVDDLALEKAMRRRRHNPLRTRRNCDMTFLSKEQEDRIVARIATARNPAGGRRTVHRWWKGLSSQKRMQVARTVLGRMNPGRSAKVRDQGSRYRNPKRDGTPTRGENRAVKYLSHLRSIVDRSSAAEQEYKRLTGAVAQAGKEIGIRATKRVMREHAEGWEQEHAAQSAPAAAVAAVVAEHPELKFLTSRISDLDSSAAALRQEIADLPKDEFSEETEGQLQEQIVKIARQKQKLRDQIGALQPVATNPRRRGPRRRLSHSTISKLRRAGDACARAVRSLHSVLRRGH